MSGHLFSKCAAGILSAVFLSTVASAQGGFVGSENCRTCHEKIYETWKESTHYKAVQALTPSNDSVIADWRGEIKLKSGKIPEVTVRLNRDAEGNYLATLVDSRDPSKSLTYRVERTQGAGSMKGQQYYVKIGNNYYALPINWQTVSSKFIPSLLDIWYNEDGSLKRPAIDKSWEMTCAGCHQTGLVYTKAGDGYEATWSELSIGCEKCHGPGSAHVQSSGAKDTIINPRKLDYERGMDVCNQCHDTSGRSVPDGVIRGAWNEVKHRGYDIGEPLSDYMQSSEGPGSPLLRPLSGDDTYHRLSNSKHHEAMTTCFDCHDPHGGPAASNLKRADFNNALCLHCHAGEKEFASPAMIMQHTKHSYDPDIKGTSRCTACHLIQSRRMRTPPAGNGMPGGMPGVMAGFLEVVSPRQSLEMFEKNPSGRYTNSCNTCHADWGGDEAGYRKGAAVYEANFVELAAGP